MAYEVTKQIKGRDYRYRVESRLNPETGRPATRWTYLGKLEGGELIAPARPVALIAARLAAGATVCLLGLAWLARGIAQRQRGTLLHPKALGL